GDDSVYGGARGTLATTVEPSTNRRTLPERNAHHHAEAERCCDRNVGERESAHDELPITEPVLEHVEMPGESGKTVFGSRLAPIGRIERHRRIEPMMDVLQNEGHEFGRGPGRPAQRLRSLVSARRPQSSLRTVTFGEMEQDREGFEVALRAVH